MARRKADVTIRNKAVIQSGTAMSQLGARLASQSGTLQKLQLGTRRMSQSIKEITIRNRAGITKAPVMIRNQPQDMTDQDQDVYLVSASLLPRESSCLHIVRVSLHSRG